VRLTVRRKVDHAADPVYVKEAALSLGFFDPAPSGLKFRRGFDDEPEYQMVPLGGTQTVGLQVLNEPGDVFVFVNDRSKAVIKSFFGAFGTPPVAQGDGLVLKPNSAVLLTIEGISVGRTKIVVESVNGGRRRVCRLSVKPIRLVTYQLGIVTDSVRVRKPPEFDRAAITLIDNMLGAERIWLSHANVALARVGPTNKVKVESDIKDPIVIDDPKTLALIDDASQTEDRVQADIYIYGCWDVVYRDNDKIGGSTTGNRCFVEGWNGRIGELICAHEVGHAFGLGHPPSTDFSLLMFGEGISDERLLAGEIEIANPA
jgi:hypothetical protein